MIKRLRSHTLATGCITLRQHRDLPDYIDPTVRILFVGINPGLRSARLGHHFAGYSNRFWKVLYRARLVPEAITYLDDGRLPTWGFGLTNLVSRPSAGIHELTRQDYETGRARLLTKIERYNPPVVALLGLTLHSIVFPDGSPGSRPKLGLQRRRLRSSAVYLLPNPSGRNAHYSLDAMVRAFGVLRKYLLHP
jgi:TDG/mug DNA glycosylase family protein